MMRPNDADWMANSVDPDQTGPQGAVWSGSALFAQAYLSENLKDHYDMLYCNCHVNRYILISNVLNIRQKKIYMCFRFQFWKS